MYCFYKVFAKNRQLRLIVSLRDSILEARRKARKNTMTTPKTTSRFSHQDIMAAFAAETHNTVRPDLYAFIIDDREEELLAVARLIRKGGQ
jgi:microcystin-dependent protein